MLDFIRKEIANREAANQTVQETVSEEVMDAAVLEYAHLIQELADLSEKGTDEFKTRKMMADIPLEDDIEIDTIEMNLTDGRITDVPMDATVQESSTALMKTVDDFMDESYDETLRFVRETDEEYAIRVREKASRKFDAYMEYVVQEGLFGFDHIPINDARVPSKSLCDFGPLKNESDSNRYYVKMPIYFQTDKKHTIVKKQLDSLNFFIGNDFPSICGPILRSLLEKKYNLEDNMYIWNIATPVAFRVPVEPKDRYAIIIEFEIDSLSKDHYFMSVSTPMKQKSKDKITKKELENTTKSVNIGEPTANYVNKSSFSSESFVETVKKPFPSRFVQEAIDMGQGMEAEGVQQNPPEMEQSPQPDDEQPSVSMDGQALDQQMGQGEPVNTNDVSDQIAEKVSDETQNNNQPVDVTDDMEVTDDDMNNVDDAATEEPAEDMTNDMSSADEQLQDLDNMTSDNTDDVDESIETGDLDKLTIDQLIEQGSEKLKGMTIEQLKNFISTASPEEIQEAFIYTSKNINKEMNILLRKALGILNDSQMSLQDIIKKFKLNGKKLNRCLNKAAKMTTVYSQDECIQINKLNKCLTDLMGMIKSNPKESDSATAKRVIKAFTSQSVVVSKIIDEHDKLNVTSESVEFNQEAMIDAGFGALRRRIQDSIGDKFDVTNVYSNPGAASIFTIKNKEDQNSTCDVALNRQAVDITTKEDWSIKDFRRGVSLSRAFDVILELLGIKKTVTESYDDFIADISDDTFMANISEGYDMSDDEYDEYMETFSTFNIVQEFNTAGLTFLSLTASPILPMIIANDKIDKSGVRLHDSIVDTLQTMKDESNNTKKLVKKLKKLTDNCRWVTFNKGRFSPETREAVGILKDKSIVLTKAIKGGNNIEAATKEFTDNCVKVDKLLSGKKD